LGVGAVDLVLIAVATRQSDLVRKQTDAFQGKITGVNFVAQLLVFVAPSTVSYASLVI
jgi:hypothetical protein